ncbi:UNVERIFIED_CONTAM: hypothetical protein Slati_2936500 [Sesamum latifolium]|uniref:Uncharacterized protein n=1 Tax=Sesamum latifolium TaxID=2727402 RepID=A0AAW2VDW1_9LAMI
MKSIGWTRQLAGRELISPRGCQVASPRARRVRAHQVASHELAGCELTRSQATSSQGANSPDREDQVAGLARSLACSSPGCWLVARRSLAHQDQVAGLGRCTPGRWLAGRRSQTRQVAGWPAIYASWRRLIGLLGRKV